MLLIIQIKTVCLSLYKSPWAIFQYYSPCPHFCKDSISEPAFPLLFSIQDFRWLRYAKLIISPSLLHIDLGVFVSEIKYLQIRKDPKGLFTVSRRWCSGFQPWPTTSRSRKPSKPSQTSTVSNQHSLDPSLLACWAVYVFIFCESAKWLKRGLQVISETETILFPVIFLIHMNWA